MTVHEFNISDSREAKWRVVVSCEPRYHAPGQNILDGPRRWTARYYRPGIEDPAFEIELTSPDITPAELQEFLEKQELWIHGTLVRWMSR